jgi:hypothetical protein
MHKVLLASVAALFLATGTAQAQMVTSAHAAQKYCTILCMQDVPRGQENAEPDKPQDARCVAVCGDTRAACEFAFENAKKFGMRTDGQCGTLAIKDRK